MKYELPEWTTPYFRENYTGPMLSNGKFQSSVPHGKAKPASRLDAFSRDHDTAYYFCNGDVDCQSIADQKYADNTSGMSFIPRTIGKIPKFVHGSKLRGTQRSHFKTPGGENMTKLRGMNPLSNVKLSDEYNRAQRLQLAADTDRKTTNANLLNVQYNPYKPKMGTTEVYTGDGIATCPMEEPPIQSNVISESPRRSEATSYDTVYEPPSSNDSIYSTISYAIARKFKRKKKKKNKIYVN